MEVKEDEELLLLLANKGDEGEFLWYHDTGASNHMTHITSIRDITMRWILEIEQSKTKYQSKDSTYHSKDKLDNNHIRKCDTYIRKDNDKTVQ